MFIHLRPFAISGAKRTLTKHHDRAPLRFLNLSSVVAVCLLGGLANVAAGAQQSSVALAAPANLPDAPGSVVASSNSDQKSQSSARDTGVISGTVLDPNNGVVPGAHVVLTDSAGAERSMDSGPNGQFTFSALPSGSYKVTVTGEGMGTFVSKWLTLRVGDIRILSQVVLPVAAASTSITVNAKHIQIDQELADQQVQIATEQRVLGVFPNFYSSYDWHAPPMGPKQKFRLAFRSMMDPMAFAGAAGLAGFEQYYNIFPGYGGGIEGYFKRYGAAYTNDFSARMLASGVFASLFHQDPRYFYKGTGSIQSRAIYAISCAYVTRDDAGHMRPNYSHILGVFAAAGLSNLYYPKESRGLQLTLVNGAVETAGNSGTDLVREFLLKGITSRHGGKP